MVGIRGAMEEKVLPTRLFLPLDTVEGMFYNHPKHYLRCLVLTLLSVERHHLVLDSYTQRFGLPRRPRHQEFTGLAGPSLVGNVEPQWTSLRRAGKIAVERLGVARWNRRWM